MALPFQEPAPGLPAQHFSAVEAGAALVRQSAGGPGSTMTGLPPQSLTRHGEHGAQSDPGKSQICQQSSRTGHEPSYHTASPCDLQVIESDHGE